jgi:hypothetical protein
VDSLLFPSKITESLFVSQFLNHPRYRNHARYRPSLDGLLLFRFSGHQ